MIVVQSSTDTFFTLLLIFFTLEEVKSQQQRTCGLGGGSSGGISGSGCRDRILLDNSFLITSSGILKKRKITCKHSAAEKELISRVHWQPKPQFQGLLVLLVKCSGQQCVNCFMPTMYYPKISPANVYLFSVPPSMSNHYLNIDHLCDQRNTTTWVFYLFQNVINKF